MAIVTPERERVELATDRPKSLASFLDQLRREQPAEVASVSRPIKPHSFEVTALLEHLAQRNDHSVLVCQQPEDMLGQPSAFPLVTNVFATRQRCADALEFPRNDHKLPLSLEFARRERQLVEPLVVDRGAAPVKQVVLRGDDIDLRRLPVVKHAEMDLMPTLTMACCMRDPDIGSYDVSFIKLFPKGPRVAGASIHSPHLERAKETYERRGERAPFICILGHHPAFYLGCLALTSYDTDDYATAGAFLGEPVRLVPSETWGDRFMVPADAEIIIEGELPPGETEIVDPFGDVTRQYQGQCARPRVEITAITHRRDAIMQDIFGGHRDHWTLGQLPKEGSVYNALQNRFGNVVSVHLPYSGCGRLACYVSIRKTKEGQGKAAALAALQESWTFNVVVAVDEDIDPFVEEDVLWAALTYTNPSRDVDLIHNLYTVFTTAMGYRKAVIDATRPLDVAFPAKLRVPPDAMERMRVEEWIQRG
jgi:2,5-furandicarboxylate decarboxylase 1